MESHQTPFKENTIVSGPGKSFPIPLGYKGWSLYFGSLDRVKVPSHLQAGLAYELNTLLTSKTFTLSEEGNTEIGRVTVMDGDRKRNFEIRLTLTETGRDDYYLVESMLEV